MTAVGNLDYLSAHSGKHLVDADPDRFEYPAVAEFVNAETTPIDKLDLSDDVVLEGMRRRLGFESTPPAAGQQETA